MATLNITKTAAIIVAIFAAIFFGAAIVEIIHLTKIGAINWKN